MEGLSFAYPAWYLIFCVLAGLAYALVLYYRDHTFRQQLPWLHIALGVVRFLAVSLLAMLLLSPLLRRMQNQTQKPVIVLAQDVSESVGLAQSGPDSAAYRQAWTELYNQLTVDYDVRAYQFGAEVTEGLDAPLTDKKTNITQVLQQVYDLYGNQNLGAVVLATDGIYNQGANPVYADVRLNAPVFAVALGDTTRRRDVSLQRVFHNRIAYLGDKFTVQVDVSALNAQGANTTLTVAKIESAGPRVLRQEPISIDNNDFFTTREIVLDADQSGVQRYRLSLSGVAGESSTANNSREIFVEILDAREKILLLAHSPHPDLTALKQSLSLGLNNEVDIAYIQNFAGDLRGYDLVVLHQLPSTRHDAAAALNVLRQQRIPTWFITGDQTNYPRFNQAQELLRINANGQNTNDVQARLAPGFSLFNLSDDVQKVTPTFPPLTSPFGEYTPGGNTSVLLTQRIGRIDTPYPLLVFGEQPGGARMAVLAGTGLWRWRLFDYLDRQNHARFDELAGKVVQFLSVKSDKRRFRVSPAKNIFDENESITFDAELYNESYELINGPDVTMVVTDPEGREFNYTFNRRDKAYALNAGILPVGTYRYRAAVNTGAEQLDFSGQFSVQPVQLESYATTADHTMLRLLSARYGGELIYPAQLASLPDRLSNQGNVKPVIFSSVTTRSIINFKGLFFLLLLLLTAEWFARRYFGAY